MSIYHMCTILRCPALLPEGWIVVVGVDNILEHFIYRVLTKHQRQNRGVAAKKGLFFAYIAGYRDVSVLMGEH